MRRLLRPARIIVETCMGIKSHENVLVITDPPRLEIAGALVRVARDAGAEVALIEMRERSRHGEEPPKTVEQAMCAADVILAPTTYSLTHTQARFRACEAGARVASMPGITEEMMSRGAMTADYEKVRGLTVKIAELLDNASKVEVKTPAGTELSIEIEGRQAHSDTGIYHKPGEWGNLPAGEAFVAPVEGTAKGEIIIDGGMASVPRGVLKIKVEKGKAVKISGNYAVELIEKLNEVGREAYWIAEFGIGTNPKAKPWGSVIESEKVFGTCHVALGNNSTFGGQIQAEIHLDGILLRPTIKLDKQTIMRDGKFLLFS